jgi:hypothetical protein
VIVTPAGAGRVEVLRIHGVYVASKHGARGRGAPHRGHGLLEFFFFFFIVVFAA